jgi:hypothetical protein
VRKLAELVSNVVGYRHERSMAEAGEDLKSVGVEVSSELCGADLP